MNMTPKQEEVIKTFWKAGEFTADDLRKVYTLKESVADCLNKFISLKIINQKFGTNKFTIDRERFLQIQDAS